MNKCKKCGKETNNDKFCSRSCAISFNNKGVRRHGLSPGNCKNCSSPLDKSEKIFCNNICQQDYASSVRIQEWLDGKINFPGRVSIKKFLGSLKKGCWKCGITTWNNAPIVLELEHVDGNSENNLLDNLELLCPNCHSQTPTYKYKNVGNGRHFRRERYKEGKSY